MLLILRIISLFVTIFFVATEAIAGWWSGSLALISDAGHNFTDAFGLVLAATAYRLEAKPGDEFKTFGYQRTGVLAAFVNALMLVVLSVFLIWESYQRLRVPEPINDDVMWIVASIGLVVNLAIAWGLGLIAAAILWQVDARDSGSSVSQKNRSGPAPSIRDASNSSSGTVMKNCRNSNVAVADAISGSVRPA